MVFRHVLAATDGSANSVQAARLAFHMVHLCGAKLTLIYVVNSAVLSEIARLGANQREEVRHELRENGRHYLDHLEALAKESGLTVGRVLCEGTPWEEIVAAAETKGVDLIVLGHVGQHSPRRMLIGSVAERVVEFARCPVLIVKG